MLLFEASIWTQVGSKWHPSGTPAGIKRASERALEMLFTRPSFSWNANIDSLSHILRSGRKKKKKLRQQDIRQRE